MKLKRVLNNPNSYFFALKKLITNQFRSIFYSGNEVCCESCGWSGKQFFSGRCPNCNSLPRTRLIPFSLRFFDLLRENDSVLHIAPNISEYNFIKSKVSNNIKYDRLNIKKFNHINLVEDLTQTSIESNTYDLAIAWHVFEHIVEDVKAIAEVYRILKPNGNFLLSVPIYPKGNEITFEDSNIPYKDYKKHHGHEDHCRSCGLDYYKRFENAGFKTKTLMVKDLDKDLISNYGLSENHVVWCFTK